MSGVSYRAVIDMQLSWHVIDMRKSCQCRQKKYFTTYIDMLLQWNGTRKYLKNNKIMSNFSRDTTFVALCWSSFILRSQCALYFWVCSISRFFFCAMNINESVISITSPEVGMVSLLYDCATEQLTIFVQNFKSYCLLTCRWHVRIFLPICRHEKKISPRQP